MDSHFFALQQCEASRGTVVGSGGDVAQHKGHVTPDD